ncbi:2-amino-4-hydroxy-6-hydroxymethyldihydropteridine diphosphokinase [Paracoccus liaowanqingii]|uniref:2-amino-4-hydroxy-6-hydroxymethyldihydropteridine pyrophosphokinase n=1 Tax=Paracoccus liaowanqingii TaxID=2560053 RepID=A0A4Z1CQY1_9RHOB|nr:2-amino-4-hydroxy-6-hydroxymethyldihydropteridine diphosphokinase [Paracoccus liaowanqingii]TGN67587.1 2-amino-4-hydroxy-6-hydroxymethyldihydropteridine diphosphokinase [Paracoccus liaowanqingii]
MADLSFGIVALGANLPLPAQDPVTTLRKALTMLQDVPQISIAAISRIWRTPAMPAGSGPDYANAVALIQTGLTAPDLLAALHGIEARHGRDRSGGRWSARALDLDLIALDDLILPDADHLRAWIDLPPDRQRVETPDRLLLPHPRQQDRAFVLAPLAEVAPGWCHPLTGRSVAQMLDALGPRALDGMTPMGGAQLPGLA